jgi:hypothetical protein
LGDFLIFMNRNSRDHIKTRPIPTIFSPASPLFFWITPPTMAWRRRPPFYYLNRKPPTADFIARQFWGISSHFGKSSIEPVAMCHHTHKKTDKNSERAGRNEPLSWAFGRTRDAKRRNGWRWPCGD